MDVLGHPRADSGTCIGVAAHHRLGAWALVLAFCACSGGRDEAWPTRLGSIQFQGVPETEAPTRGEIALAVDSALGHSPLFRPAMQGESEGVLALDLSVSWTKPIPEASSPGAWMVAMTLESPELMRSKGAPPSFDVVLMVDVQAGLPPDAARSLALESALGRGLSVLDAKSRLSLGTPDQAARLLESSDLELRLLALNWVGTQGTPNDAPLVAPFLQSEDPRVAEAAVFALTRVGTSAQVPALIALTMASDGSVARQAYLALGEIGGTQARAYLSFAARNEDEPQRRRAAELALRSTGSDLAPGEEPDLLTRSHRR